MKKVLAIMASGTVAVVLLVSVARAREVPQASAPPSASSTSPSSTAPGFIKWWRCSITRKNYFAENVCLENCVGGTCILHEPGALTTRQN